MSSLWLFHRELVATLRAAGVHNLEVFDAEVTDMNRGGELLRTHQAINVVGVGSLDAMHAAGLRSRRLPMLEFHVLR